MEKVFKICCEKGKHYFSEEWVSANLKPLLGLYFLIALFLLAWDNQGVLQPQYWDAAVYTTLSGYWPSNFPQTYRGYFFPLVLHIFYNIFNSNIYILLINLSCLFILSFYAVPHIATAVFSRPFSKIKCFLFSIIFLYFWWGYFSYALSDVIGVTALLTGIALITKKDKLSLFLGGMALAAAINIRPVYELNFLIGLAYMLWQIFHKNIPGKMLIAFLLGALLVFIPQMQINHNYKSYSPLVMTQFYPGAVRAGNGSSIYNLQLTIGLRVEKYETYAGDLSKYPHSAIIYTHGDELKNRYMEYNLQQTAIGYVKFVLKNPLHMAKVYFLHFFNGLDIKTNTPYIQHIRKLLHIRGLNILNYIILIGGFFSLFFALFKRKDKEDTQKVQRVLYLTTVALPIFFVLPVAVEIRFFLPLFVLLYISFLQFPRDICSWSKKALGLFLVFFIGLVIAATYMSQTMSHHIVF